MSNYGTFVGALFLLIPGTKELIDSDICHLRVFLTGLNFMPER